MSETEIMRDILVAVSALPGTMFWRENSAVAVTASGAVIRAGVPGVPDIVGIHRGRWVGIEVKTPRGKQSEQQLRFQAACERAGGVYILARSVDDAMRGLA